MQQSIVKMAFLLLLSTTLAFAQKPTKPNSVEIYNQIQKLNFLGSVLYVAAHPDDENTRLISYLANENCIFFHRITPDVLFAGGFQQFAQ
jgi:hypothetical protein